MKQHTPGPWTTDVTQRMRHDNTIPVRHADGKMVAFAADFNQYDRDAEVEANARLIAAAPELLAACQAALEYVDSFRLVYTGSVLPHGARPIHAQLTAAIAKAQPAPTPADTQEARHRAAYANAHADGECGPGCPWCEEAEAKSAIVDASDDALEPIV